MKTYNEILSDVTKTATKIPQSDYLDAGKYRIFDQGKEYSIGFSNDEQGVVTDYPYIIFGDHTRVVKYVDEPCYIGADGVKLLKVINKDFDPRYVYYNILAKPIESQGYARHFKFLKEIQFTEKSFSEQQKIATELDSIQSAIDNKKQQLSLLDEAVKSEFVEMFGENPIENGKWKVEKLGDCLYGIENGKSFVCSAESRKDGFPAILKLSSVTYGEFIPEENKALLNNDMFVADAEVHKGDLLFTRKNTPELVGMSAYVFTDEKKLMMPDLIFRLNTRDCLNKVFLWKLINHTIFRGKIRNLASGAAESMSNISKVRLQTLPIPVPPLDLQNQFAAFVQQIDKSKSLAKQQIADLQELLDSKMQQYFA